MSNGSESGPPAATLVNAFATTPSPMLVTDARASDNPIIWANEAFLQLTGYTLDEVRGRNCRFLQGPETDRDAVDRLRAAIAAGEPISIELLNYRKDGTPFRNAFTVTPVRDAQGISHFFAAQTSAAPDPQPESTVEDVERQVAERTTDLQAALDQKTAMLHAIDHRVNNNLQVISSLMLLKARRTPEGDARDVLQGMAERIGALSAAQRLLSSEGDGTHFDLGEVVAELLSDLEAGLPDERVRIEAEIEPMSLPAAMAAPLALMIHELAANALRHGFPEDREGSVSLSAHRTAEGMRLAIRDDGIGVSRSDPNPTGFGHSLVEMVVRQLRGSIRWSDADPGTRIEIDVPLPAGM